MGITNVYKFELEKTDIKSVVETFRSVIKNFNCPEGYTLICDLKDFTFAQSLFGEIEDVYAKEFKINIKGRENLSNNTEEEINQKYFKITDEFKIDDLIINLWSTEADESVEAVLTESIEFIMNEYYKPSIEFGIYEGIKRDFKTDEDSRWKETLEFLQKCINVLGINAEAKTKIKEKTMPPRKYISVELNPGDKKITLTTRGGSLGNAGVLITPISNQLEEATILFKKLSEAHLFVTKKYSFTLGTGIKQLSQITQKYVIPITKTHGYVSKGFDDKIFEILGKIKNIEDRLEIIVEFTDLETIEREYSEFKLELKNDTGEIYVSLDKCRSPSDREEIIDYVSKVANKKVVYSHTH